MWPNLGPTASRWPALMWSPAGECRLLGFGPKHSGSHRHKTRGIPETVYRAFMPLVLYFYQAYSSNMTM